MTRLLFSLHDLDSRSQARGIVEVSVWIRSRAGLLALVGMGFRCACTVVRVVLGGGGWYIQ